MRKRLWILIAISTCILLNIINYIHIRQIENENYVLREKYQSDLNNMAEQYMSEIESLNSTIEKQETELQNIKIQQEEMLSQNNVENADDIQKETMEAYREFLNGERKIDEDLTLDDMIIPTGEPEKHYSSKYTFYDVNGDEIPELHLWSAKNYYILSYKNNELYIWTSLYAQTTLFNDGTFLYSHTSMGNENYIYFEFDSQGNEVTRINFSRYDKNHDGKFNEEDAYYYGGIDSEVTKEEWNILVKKYFIKKSDDIKWITIYDSTS